MLTSYIRRKIRKAVLTLVDPLVPVKIGNREIEVRLSHQLPENLKHYPHYNFNLGRIIALAETHFGKLTVIDVGANVGDTVAFIRNFSEAPILCIDGEEKYVRLLRRNIAQFKNVSICQTLLGSETKTENFALKMREGTAQVEASKEQVSVRSLEDVLQEFPEFQNSKILKTDTDGFDTHIIRGSKNFLEKTRPVLFFEFDPHFIRKTGDDPFRFFDFLMEAGYAYFMFYSNIGDYLLSSTAENKTIITDLIHYYSGRNIEIFMDVCAFTEEDKNLYEKCRASEIEYFQKARHY